MAVDMSVDVDIDIYDFLYSLDTFDREELVDELVECDWFHKLYSKKLNKQVNESEYDDDFDNAAAKLINNGWRLSLEDQETIKKIAEKIIQ
jgi:hypothetical protein